MSVVRLYIQFIILLVYILNSFSLSIVLCMWVGLDWLSNHSSNIIIIVII